MNINSTGMQVVLTSEYSDAWQLRLSELPNVSVVSYNISSYGEMEIRQQIRATQRALGLSGLRDIFGLPKHSEPLLQDTELHRQIMVCTNPAWVNLCSWHRARNCLFSHCSVVDLTSSTSVLVQVQRSKCSKTLSNCDVYACMHA